MKSTDDLFQLIKSLTKSEKRYFKVAVSKKSGDNEKNYLKLFNAIDKQKKYDEKKIVQQFSGSTFIKHLPSEKNYLYNQVLKSLHMFYSSYSKDKTPDEFLHYSEILYKKGFYQQSKKITDKARELIYNSESYSYLFKSSQYHVNLASKLAASYKEMEESFSTALADSKTAIEKISNELGYFELHCRLFLLMRKEGESIRKEHELQRLEDIIHHPLMESETKALTYEAKAHFYWIKGIYSTMTNDWEASFYYTKKELELAESHPGKTDDLSAYSKKIANLCNQCLRLKKYKPLSVYLGKLHKLKEIPGKPFQDEVEIFYRYYGNLLTKHTQTGEFEEGILLVREIEKGLEKYKDRIHKSRAIDLYYYIAYAYFGEGDYKNCLKWINVILNDKTDLRRDFLSYIRILNYLAHYEMGNNLILEHVVKSTRHFLDTRDKMYKTESLVLKYLKKLPNAKSKKELAVLYTEFKNSLLPLLENPMEKIIFDYLDILSWLESKIENKNLSGIIKSKMKEE